MNEIPLQEWKTLRHEDWMKLVSEVVAGFDENVARNMFKSNLLDIAREVKLG